MMHDTFHGTAKAIKKPYFDGCPGKVKLHLPGNAYSY